MDAVVKSDPRNGRDVPFCSEIKTAARDCASLKSALDRYRITDNDRVYSLEADTTHARFMEVYGEIEHTLETNSDTNYVVI